MFCCCFFLSFLFLFSARSPRSLGRSPRNFSTWSEMGAILKLGPKIGGSSPKTNWGRKTFFFRRDFGRLRTSIANIPGTEQDIDNRKTALQTTISPATADVIWWTFGPQRRKIGPYSLRLPNSQHVWCACPSLEAGQNGSRHAKNRLPMLPR